MKTSDLDRFLPKFEILDNGCWNWSAATRRGYGAFWLGGKAGRHHQAHEVAYEVCVGPVPEGLCLDHLCHNRACVNPDHLEPVTMRENLVRGNSPVGLNSRKTRCPQGHAYTLENTYTSKACKRHCRECNRTKAREYQRSKRAKTTAS